MKWSVRDAALAMAAVGLILGAASRSSAALKLYVTNSEGGDISVIDVANRTVLRSIVAGDHVHGACAASDGSRLYTTVSGEKALKVIDTASDKIVDVIPLNGWPNQCASTPDGRYVAIPDYPQNQIEIVDLRTRSTVKKLGIPHPHNCYNWGSNATFVCSSMGMRALYRIDLATLGFTGKYILDEEPRPFAVIHGGGRAYVQVTGYNGFEVAAPSVGGTVRPIDLPPAPISSCLSESGPETPSHGIALSPDDGQLWIDSLGDGMVYSYDTKTLSLRAKLKVGACPSWIAASPDGRYIAVSLSAEDAVALIDRASAREVARIPVGREPKRLVFVDVKGGS